MVREGQTEYECLSYSEKGRLFKLISPPEPKVKPDEIIRIFLEIMDAIDYLKD